VFIHRQTRLVRIAGVIANPVTGWVTQHARNLSMDLADQANTVRFPIRDRDTKFTASFDAVFAAEGTRIIKRPVRAPRANTICECASSTSTSTVPSVASATSGNVGHQGATRLPR